MTVVIYKGLSVQLCYTQPNSHAHPSSPVHPRNHVYESYCMLYWRYGESAFAKITTCPVNAYSDPSREFLYKLTQPFNGRDFTIFHSHTYCLRDVVECAIDKYYSLLWDKVLL